MASMRSNRWAMRLRLHRRAPARRRCPAAAPPYATAAPPASGDSPSTRASHEDYQDSILPTGHTAGSPRTKHSTAACGLYLADPTAWIEAITDTPTN